MNPGCTRFYGIVKYILCVCRLSSIRPRPIQEGTTVMKRCALTQMSPLLAKCSGGLTALKTNTSTAQATAEERLSIHTGPETGMEVRINMFRLKKKKNLCYASYHCCHIATNVIYLMCSFSVPFYVCNLY